MGFGVLLRFYIFITCDSTHCPAVGVDTLLRWYLPRQLFYQIKGDMVLRIMEQGKVKDVPIKEGEVCARAYPIMCVEMIRRVFTPTTHVRLEPKALAVQASPRFIALGYIVLWREFVQCHLHTSSACSTRARRTGRHLPSWIFPRVCFCYTPPRRRCLCFQPPSRTRRSVKWTRWAL